MEAGGRLTVLLKIESVDLAEEFGAQHIDQAIVGAWDLLFDLIAFRRHDAHRLGVAELSNEGLLLLRHIEESNEGRVREEYVLGEWDAGDEFREISGLLKVPE